MQTVFLLLFNNRFCGICSSTHDISGFSGQMDFLTKSKIIQLLIYR